MSVVHAPRKQARQARAVATTEAIVEGAARILETSGLSALTTNRIAEVAGVSIGSLYQYFPNRDAVLAALIRREDGKLKQKFAEIAGDWTEPYSAAEALIDALIGHKFMRPQLAMALDRLELPLGLEQEEHEGLRSTAVLVGRLVRGLAPGAGPRAAQDLVAICHGLSYAALREAEHDLHDIRIRLLRAVYGYLGVPAPAFNDAC